MMVAQTQENERNVQYLLMNLDEGHCHFSFVIFAKASPRSA